MYELYSRLVNVITGKHSNNLARLRGEHARGYYFECGALYKATGLTLV
ncbi:hypothetical protein [Desulfopila sp. IMCC35008]|nr:hypothetical protein [Desulfopila sp. IMCC35008]